MRGVHEPARLGELLSAQGLPVLQKRHEPAGAVDLGDDVASALDQLVGVVAVGGREALQGAGQVLDRDVRQELHPEDLSGPLAGRSPGPVLAVVQGVLGLGVDDQEGQALGGQVEGHVGHRAVAAVQLQGVTLAAAHGGRLVHAAGGGPGHLVLRAHAVGHQAGAPGVVGLLRSPGQAQVRDLVNGDGGRALQGRRGGQSASQGHAGDECGVEAGQVLEAVALQGPGDAGDVGGPVRHLPGGSLRTDRVEVHDVDLLPGLGGDQAHDAVLAAPQRQVRPVWQGDGQGQAAVVVGVLANDVDAPGGVPDAVGLGLEDLPEQGGGGLGALLGAQRRGEDGSIVGHRVLLWWVVVSERTG